VTVDIANLLNLERRGVHDMPPFHRFIRFRRHGENGGEAN
jgi:hypothetical protein